MQENLFLKDKVLDEYSADWFRRSPESCKLELVVCKNREILKLFTRIM